MLKYYGPLCAAAHPRLVLWTLAWKLLDFMNHYYQWIFKLLVQKSKYIFNWGICIRGLVLILNTHRSEIFNYLNLTMILREYILRGFLKYLNYGFTILRLMNCILENFGLFDYFWKRKFYLNLLEDFVWVNRELFIPAS